MPPVALSFATRERNKLNNLGVPAVSSALPLTAMSPDNSVFIVRLLRRNVLLERVNRCADPKLFFSLFYVPPAFVVFAQSVTRKDETTFSLEHCI